MAGTERSVPDGVDAFDSALFEDAMMVIQV